MSDAEAHAADEWARALHAMTDEWAHAGAAASEARRAATARLVQDWEAAQAAMRADEASLRAAGRWVGGPDNLLAVIGFAQSETVHSAVLGWLLDPTSRHGLGSLFLEGVLARCFPHERFAELEAARVATEVPCPSGRLDILVTAPDLTLVVENKIDAIERPNQCADYYADFCREIGARFVFLTPNGRPPATAEGDAAEAFVPLSYRVVRDVLREALHASSAREADAQGRAAAEQYLAALQQEFP